MSRGHIVEESFTHYDEGVIESVSESELQLEVDHAGHGLSTA